jgi:hypothetical protein
MAGAIEALMLVVELGGPTMFARIGVMRALNALNARPDAAWCFDQIPNHHQEVKFRVRLSSRGWQREFDQPIPPSDGRVLRTLHDAGI